MEVYLYDPNGTLRLQYFNGKLSPRRLLYEQPGQSSELTVPGALPPGEWEISVYINLDDEDVSNDVGKKPDHGYHIVMRHRYRREQACERNIPR